MKIDLSESNPKAVLWVLWWAITSVLVIVYMLIPPPESGSKLPPVGLDEPRTFGTVLDLAVPLLPVIPLAISGFIRWVMLPKADTFLKAGPIFILGMAMAAGGGILAIFLGYPSYLAVVLITLMQFAPSWAAKLK